MGHPAHCDYRHEPYPESEMTASAVPQHVHDPATTTIVRQRQGIPYEVQQVICTSCRKLLQERKLRRAAG
jgi:NMD protein affecting ribosome stability and mRNA decay